MVANIPFLWYNKSMEYQIIYSDRKTIAAVIGRDGKLIVRAPKFCPRFVISSFVSSKRQLLEKERQRILSLPPIPTITKKEAEELRRRTEEKILPKLTDWSRVTGIRYQSVKITKARGRFGSCSIGGNLCFSLFLGLAEDSLIDYVIVHELCHIRHHDHSSDFYRLVETFLPDRRERERALKKMVIPQISD